jgi:K+-sensing histidine kinase KdpD
VQDLQNKVSNILPKESAAIEWDSSLQDEILQIDPELLQQAMIELVINAFRHGQGTKKLSLIAKPDGDSARLELREPKDAFDLPTENWGGAPLGRVTRGHYGLGLYRARTVVESLGGKLKARYDSQTCSLVTTVILPLSTDG